MRVRTPGYAGASMRMSTSSGSPSWARVPGMNPKSNGNWTQPAGSRDLEGSLIADVLELVAAALRGLDDRSESTLIVLWFQLVECRGLSSHRASPASEPGQDPSFREVEESPLSGPSGAGRHGRSRHPRRPGCGRGSVRPSDRTGPSQPPGPRSPPRRAARSARDPAAPGVASPWMAPSATSDVPSSGPLPPSCPSTRSPARSGALDPWHSDMT